MANETTSTTAASTIYAKIISSNILMELRPYQVHRPHFRMGEPGPSAVYSFTKQTKLAPSNVASVSEAADQTTFTAMATGNADATAAKKGIIARVTDELIVTSVLDALPHFSGVLARTMGEQYETDLAATPAFTNVTGSSGALTNMSLLLKARAALAGRDVTGPLACILHTKQVGDCQLDIAQSGATYLAGNEHGATSVLEAGLNGYAFNAFGIQVQQTSVVPTADSGASRAGYLFVSGVALGLYELWGIRTELQRKASASSTDVVLTMNYGTVQIDNSRGQTVKGTA